MLMRRARAYGSSCSQLISVYLHPFCPKFRCHGNQGESGLNLDDTVRLAIFENHTLELKITTLSYTQPEL